MTTRRIGAGIGIATLIASGTYVALYLARWEWNRAITSGLIFVAVEVALTTWLLNDRLRSVERRLEAQPKQRDRALGRLQETAPLPHRPFAWLQPTDGMNVFVPLLMGAGLLLSVLAWLVERVARVTAGPVLESGLAVRLSKLHLPEDGLVGGGNDDLELLRGPTHGRAA